MPILDYTAGRGALSGVQAATANLINANQARAQGVQNGFLTAAQLFRQVQKDKEESTTRELENEKIKAVTQGQNIQNQYAPDKYRAEIDKDKATTAYYNTNTNLVQKKVDNYDKELEADILAKKAQAANASASAANTNLITQQKRELFKEYQQGNSDDASKQSAMINFGAIINARKNYGDLQ